MGFPRKFKAKAVNALVENSDLARTEEGQHGEKEGFAHLLCGQERGAVVTDVIRDVMASR